MKVLYAEVIEWVRASDRSYQRHSSGKWEKWSSDVGWWPVDEDKGRTLEAAYQEYKTREGES